MKYYLIDYYTGKTINVFTDVYNAITECKAIQNSQVTTETGAILYTNIDLPF